MPPQLSASIFPDVAGHYRPGNLRFVNFPNPGAGNGLTMQVPGGRWWRFLGVHITLLTDAVVESRTFAVTMREDVPSVQISGTSEIWVGPCGFTVAASQGVEWGLGASMNPGVGSIEATGVALITQIAHTSIPYMWLGGGWTLNVATFDLDTGDQFTNINAYVEELWHPEDRDYQNTARQMYRDERALMGEG